MWRRRVTILLTGIFYILPSYAQVRQLTIGDQLPEIKLSSVINYGKPTVDLSDFRGKLLILDFWATWCSPCVESFGKLDSLQRMYASDVQILPVTTEDIKLVKIFLNKYRKQKGILPYSITNDSVLSTYFKYTYLPHYVWVNREGKVIAITEGHEVTKSNIEKAIRSDIISLKAKKDESLQITESRTLFLSMIGIENNGRQEMQSVSESNIIRRSIFSRYIKGLKSGFRVRDSTVVTIFNRSVMKLYQLALLGNKIEAVNISSIKVEVPDSVLYQNITGLRQDGSPFLKSGFETEKWLSRNGYCYEITVPPGLARNKYQIMLDEINSYFSRELGIEGLIEDRKEKYLALVRISSDDKIASKGGNALVQKDKFSLRIRNKSLASLKSSLAVPLQNYPVLIDETNYKKKVDLELECQLSDLVQLNKELEKFGLQLIEKIGMLKTAVIRTKTAY